jgi:hypothetical protein
MSETEKIILYLVGGFFLLSILKGGLGTNPLALAQVNAAQNIGIANAASSAIGSIADAFSGDGGDN